jgi:hypothetical protein
MLSLRNATLDLNRNSLVLSSLALMCAERRSSLRDTKHSEASLYYLLLHKKVRKKCITRKNTTM